MNTKLMLTIEESVIKNAKKYASGKRRSLSDVVENYLKVIAHKVEDKQNHELTPLVKSLKGAFKAPKDFDYKKELSKSLYGKYIVNKKILIDTDVILDFFFDRKPFSDDAAQVLALCESHEITGYVTSVIVSNVYYILRQTAGHQKVVDKLKQLLSFTEILPTNQDMIHQALNSGFKDFEDAIQKFSAEMIGQVDVIITQTIKDYKNSTLGVMTPENFLKIIRVSEVSLNND